MAQKESFLHLNNVSFMYPSQTTELFSGLTVTFAPGWTGIIGQNGAGKTTLLKIIAGQLEASGQVSATTRPVYCSQEVTPITEELSDLLLCDSEIKEELVRLLQIDYDWPYRWHDLSFGEQKRAQLAAILAQQPQALLLDEPNNHLDGEARNLIQKTLTNYPGIGIIVSHDRDLLDELCDHCLFLPQGEMLQGGVSAGLAAIEADMEYQRREFQKTRLELQRITREQVQRREEASASHRKRSKRGLGIKDHDARFKKNLARVTNKDGAAGKLLNQLNGRANQLKDSLDGFNIEKQGTQGIRLNSIRSKSDSIFHLPYGGYLAYGSSEVQGLQESGRLKSEVSISSAHGILLPELIIKPGQRIALTGPNGSGKTTLLRMLMTKIPSHQALLYLPQELSQRDRRNLLDRLFLLNTSQRGEVLGALKRLGSDPQSVLASAIPSPGEARKLSMAFGLSQAYELLVLDEPTNHLDLSSIQLLEEALQGFSGALITVSHDPRFLRATTETEWELRKPSEGLAGLDPPAEAVLSIHRVS